MNTQVEKASATDDWREAEVLVEAALLDTVYGDIYLQRARDILRPYLTQTEFESLQLLETEALNLQVRISTAMNQAKWMEVKELSSRMSSLKEILTKKTDIRQLGKRIYEPGEPSLDPFSPGLQELARKGDPQPLLNKLSDQLERLQMIDPQWKKFYAARRSAVAGIRTYSSLPVEGREVSGSQLERQALEALESGDFAKLEKMAALIGREETGEAVTGPGGPIFHMQLPDLTFEFSGDAVGRAQAFGLAPMHLEACSPLPNLSPEEMARLYRHLWHPTVTDDAAGLRKKEIEVPADAPEAFRDLVQLFASHPFVNSGGARFIPVLAEEDVLVEDFDEPDPGEEPPVSQLLSILGFQYRRGLSRSRLEKALADRGSAVIEEMGLDVQTFRLVCIPPDVYGRIGHRKGWGQKPLWTHFDGYMVMKDGNLGALAGGDVRFGGLYDLIGISRNYDSDQIISRFAVVQRRRMEATNCWR